MGMGDGQVDPAILSVIRPAMGSNAHGDDDADRF
jgi:hypothetical protein